MYGSERVTWAVEPDSELTNCPTGVAVLALDVIALADQFNWIDRDAICFSSKVIILSLPNGL
jgi:hypothetical protein